MKKLIKEIEPTQDIETSKLAPLKARLPNFIGAPADALERLTSLRVAVIGVGSVGINVALNLARLQIAEVRLIDSGKIKPESLLTHPVFPEDCSSPKASTAGRLFKRLSHASQVMVFDGPIQALELNALAHCDFVILATDNLLAEVETAQRCLFLGIPLIQASVHGETLVAQVRFFGNRSANDACPVCGFTRAEWAAVNRHSRFSCEGFDPLRENVQPIRDPTVSVSFLCAQAASLAMVQLLRCRLGLGKEVENTFVEMCGYTHRGVVSPLDRNDECPLEHAIYQRVISPRPIPQCTLRELLLTAGFCDENLEGLSVRVGNLVFCEFGVCGCTQMKPYGRFIAAGQPPETCSCCQGSIQPLPFYSHFPLPAIKLAGKINTPFRNLGVTSAGWAVIRGLLKGVLIEEPEHERRES